MATKKDGIDLQFSIATKEANENLRQLSSQVTTLNKSLGVTEETMKGTSKSVDDYKNKISDLNKQKDLLIKKQEENKRMLKLAIESYGDASDEARKWTNEILDNEKKLVKVNNAIDKTEDQMQEYIKTNKDAENSNEKLNKSLDNVKDGFTIVKGVISNLISSGLQKFFSEVTGSMDDAIDRLDTMNNFPKVMENLGIGAKESEKAIKKLSDGLQGIPTTLNDGALAVQKFTSKNGDIEKSVEMFLAVNDAILAGGASTQIQSSALEQLSQAYSKGKMDMTEWRSIQTAMPAQLKQVATAMGLTTDELGEMMRQGDNTAEVMDQFIETIIKMDREGVNGFKSLKEQARNATGGIKTSMTNLKTAITRGVSSLIEQFDKALKSKGLGGISKIISDISTGVGNLFKEVGKWMPTIINVISTIFNVLDKLKPVIIAVVSAFISYKAAVTVASTAMSTFNTILNANPFTLVLGSVSALIGLLTMFETEAQKSANKTKEISDSINEYKKEMEQLSDAREKYLSKNIAELDHYDNLYRELQLITDENGKIKEGYEERAKFITTTLSEALGIEIEIVDGQVQKYGELGNAITDVIEKKKMEALLNAHEDEYNKAISDKTDLEEKYAKSVKNLNEKQKEYNKHLKEFAKNLGITEEHLDEYVRKGKDAQGMYDDLDDAIYNNNFLLNDYRNILVEYSDNLDSAIKLEKEAGKTLSDNQEVIYNYTTATGLLAENNYEDMKKIYDDTIHFTGKTVEDNRKIYETNISNNQAYLDRLIANQDKYSEDFINSEKDRIAKQEEQWKVELEKANNNLENQNTVKTNKVIEGINKQLEAIDSKKYEFRDAGNGNMQLYVDGVAEGEPIAEEEAISLSNTVTTNLKNGKWEAQKAGNYLVEGVQLGINEKKGSLFSSVTSLAQNVLNSLKEQWDINSPSKATKQFGHYLLQGLNLGIKDESKDSLKTISDFGNQVLSTFGSTVSNVSSEFDSMKLDNIITPQFTQEVTEKATTIRETRPIILNIDTFNNNTDRDIESLSNELAFYVRQKEVTG